MKGKDFEYEGKALKTLSFPFEFPLLYGHGSTVHPPRRVTKMKTVDAVADKKTVKKKRAGTLRKELPLHLMLIPGLILTIIFLYTPMVGILMAFEKFNPVLGFFKSKWVGLKNFEYIFKMRDFKEVLFNSFYISGMKIVATLLASLILALLINEVNSARLKKFIQTSIFIPYFLSWILLGGIVIELFSLDGPVNLILTKLFNIEPIFFMTRKDIFPFLLVGTDVWKNMGYKVVIFLAAITGINPNLYEAANVDGATRLQQCWYVTLPGMLPIIILDATLSIGSILDAGFEQVLVLYNPTVYATADILDTFSYRLGLISGQYAPAAAIGLFRSCVSLVLVSLSYWLAYKFSRYRIF